MNDTITLPRSVVEQALAAFEQLVRRHYKLGTEYDARAKALRAALEPDHCEHHLNMVQPQVEQPVAWLFRDANNHNVTFLERTSTPLGYRGEWIKTPLYTQLQPPRQPLPPQADMPLTQEQLTVFKYGWKCAESAHGIGGKK